MGVCQKLCATSEGFLTVTRNTVDYVTSDVGKLRGTLRYEKTQLFLPLFVKPSPETTTFEYVHPNFARKGSEDVVSQLTEGDEVVKL